MNILEGKALIKRSHWQKVRKRSGISGKYYFNDWPGTGDPQTHSLIRPCHQSTPAQAKEASAKLGRLSQGLTITKAGIAVKVLATDKLEAKKLMDPDYAATVGDDLLGLVPEDGYYFQAMGVPYDFRDKGTATQLIIPPRRLFDEETKEFVTYPKWNCEPITKLEGGTFGTKTCWYELYVTLTPN